jgi:hypothetical protein
MVVAPLASQVFRGSKNNEMLQKKAQQNEYSVFRCEDRTQSAHDYLDGYLTIRSFQFDEG